MLSIGWVEMLVVASFALIVVGPRDLPAMLRQIGKVAGTARRMSNEFRSELNKVTALDEVRDIQKSIKEPFTDIKSGLASEFNKIGTSGSVEPTGALKQDDSGTESVVDDIRAKAGLAAREGMNKAAVAKRDAAAAASAAASAAPKAAVADAKDVPATKTQKAKTTAKPRDRAKPTTSAKPKTAAKPRASSKPKTTAAKTPRKPRAKATTAAVKAPVKSTTKKTPAKTSVGEA